MDISGAIQRLIDWLLNFFQSIADWFVDIVQSLFQWLFDGVLSALASLVEAIPVPGWLQSGAGLFSGISSDIAWFASAVNLSFGLTVVVSAYGIRFLIRRIPVIG